MIELNGTEDKLHDLHTKDWTQASNQKYVWCMSIFENEAKRHDRLNGKGRKKGWSRLVLNEE